jgi:hypothetical protein
MRVQVPVPFVLAFLLQALNLFGQGTVNFSNLGAGDNQKVYVEYPGGTQTLAPAGTTYSLGLYWAPDGTTDETAFAMVGAPTGIIGAPGTPSGLFNGGTRAVPVTPAGGFAMLQVRGWETAFGNSYEQAAASGVSGLGRSTVFRVDTDISSPGANILNQGFTSFAIVVPEPATYALGLLGIGLFFFLRRRR